MEIVERYLHAIGFWLPKQQRKDIIAEISEDLHSSVEERQEQLGRSLNQGELETLIRQRGNPMLVANRYLPQRWLIGPKLFPVYGFVLKIIVFGWLPIWMTAMVTAHLVQHPMVSWMETADRAMGWLWTAAFTAVGTITVAFAILEKVEEKTHFLEKFNPGKLPPARNPNEIKRANSVAELVTQLAGLFLLVRYGSHLNILNGPNVQVLLAPVWMTFFWNYLVLALLYLALGVMNTLRPYWTTPRAVFRLGVDTVGGVLWCWLMRTQIIAALAIANVSAERALEIKKLSHLLMERMFPYSVVVVLVILGFDVYRVLRLRALPAEASGYSAVREAIH